MTRRCTALLTLALLALASAALSAAFAQDPTGTPPPTATRRPDAPVTPYPFWGTYTPPAQTPVYDVPPPVPMLDADNDALVNVLLLGSDSPDNFYRRTDVMVLVSINTRANTVAMWRIPRHLFVYIPNYTLDMINTVYARAAGDPDGAFPLLSETFRYNFGIEIDHYARVNYPGFMRIVDALGGLQITVDCAVSDWRLKDPALDPGVVDNWEEYTLGVGRHTLTPYMALWYARSRVTTTELDRGRRQMDILRAMWLQMKQNGVLSQVRDLWPSVVATVDTDMGLDDILPLIPLATQLEMSQIARYGGAEGFHYQRVYTPDNGREVLLPNRLSLLPMLQDFLTPPTANRLGRGDVSIEVVDASWFGYGLEHVAADRLAWDGYGAYAALGVAEVQRELTVIYDYTGQTLGSALPDLQRVLRVDDPQVIRMPDPNRSVDFRVEIGQRYHACEYGQPQAIALPESVPDAGATGALCWLRFSAGVNVRAGPDTAYDILDVATPNDQLPVTGRTPDGQWWQVSDDGETGWVSALVTNALLSGDCTSVPAVASP